MSAEMNFEKLSEGLSQLRDGIDTILSAIHQESRPTEEKTTTVASPKTMKVTPKPVSSPETPEELPDSDSVTAESLHEMSYNNVKKLAASMGLSAKGARSEIEERILNADSSEPVKNVAASEPVAEKKPTTKKLGKKTAEPEPDPEPEEVDEVTAKVMSVTDSMSTEEIADFLSECGISAKGKREALIAKLIKAVKDGDVELGDEDDSEDDSEESEDEPTSDDDSGDSEEEEEEEEEEDDTNDFDNPNMTDERKAAIKDYTKEVKAGVKSKEITRSDMVEFLQGYYDDDDDYSEYSDSEVMELYVDAACRMIDDEGNFIEEEGTPYTVNGVNYCCGVPLTYNEDDNNYICEKCGAEFEAE